MAWMAWVAWVAWMAWMAWHGGMVAYLHEGKQTLVFGSFRMGQEVFFSFPLRTALPRTPTHLAPCNIKIKGLSSTSLARTPAAVLLLSGARPLSFAMQSSNSTQWEKCKGTNFKCCIYTVATGQDGDQAQGLQTTMSARGAHHFGMRSCMDGVHSDNGSLSVLKLPCSHERAQFTLGQESLLTRGRLFGNRCL